MIPSSSRVRKATTAAVAVVVVGGAVLLASRQPAQSPGPGAAAITNRPVSAVATDSTGAATGHAAANPARTVASPPALVRHTSRPPGGPTSSPVAKPPPRTGSPTQSTGTRPPDPGTGAGSLIWAGGPSAGRSQFALVDCPKPGSLTVENDLQFGPIWVFSKPAGDAQCGAHGIAPDKAKYSFSDNTTYYISWWSKVSNTANNSASFQWAAYGAGMAQDAPFTISARNGHATVVQDQPGSSGRAVWTSSAPLTADRWNHYVVGIHTSDTPTGGWIELWYDGTLQRFADGTTQYVCRTWDGGSTPKWGEYGAQNTAVTDYVYAPKVGTSYASVAS